MAELIFFTFLFAPVLLVWWLFAAKRKADALVRARAEQETPPPATLAYEEMTAGADGLNYGRNYAGDDATFPPDDPTSSLAGIKAIEGRR